MDQLVPKGFIYVQATCDADNSIGRGTWVLINLSNVSSVTDAYGIPGACYAYFLDDTPRYTIHLSEENMHAAMINSLGGATQQAPIAEEYALVE